MRKIAILVLMILLAHTVTSQVDTLRSFIQNLQAKYRATIGLAVLSVESGDSMTWNGSGHFPMQSVYKFHLGLKVCKMAEEGRFFLDQPVLVRKRDLLPDTWSPLREKYPAGEVVIPLRDILAFTVSKSDNNGCDILFRMVGGTAAVEQFYHNLGYGQISVKATEEEMHKEYSAQFSNWTTPWQTVCILRDFYQGKLITGRQYDLLWEQLVKTETGSGRIKALLPPEVTVAHKTGSSGMNSQGISAATNDVGIICLPDGRHIALAVFIVESREKPDINERIIAEIARKVYDSLR